jgi:hypothetical protein
MPPVPEGQFAEIRGESSKMRLRNGPKSHLPRRCRPMKHPATVTSHRDWFGDSSMSRLLLSLWLFGAVLYTLNTLTMAKL